MKNRWSGREKEHKQELQILWVFMKKKLMSPSRYLIALVRLELDVEGWLERSTGTSMHTSNHNYRDLSSKSY